MNLIDTLQIAPGERYRLEVMHHCDCPFCAIIWHDAPVDLIATTPYAIVIRPLNPVVPGHLLVIPVEHFESVRDNALGSAHVMESAAQWLAYSHDPRYRSANFITSVGAPATQTVKHMHLHIVPRVEGDTVSLPWDVRNSRSS